jgi:hypothetical protein
MAFSIRRFLVSGLIAFTALVGSLSVPVIALGTEIAGLDGEAAASIQAKVEADGFRYPVASIFYGDVTGRGTHDAISFIYHDSGGSAPQLTTWIWRDVNGVYMLARTVPIDEVFGLDPRNVTFSLGRIVVMTSVPKANDPHCCPTGERTFTLEVDINDTPENTHAASTHSSGNWRATAIADPAMVNVTGTSTDGKATFSGGCNLLLGTGFSGSLYGYGGDALRRIDDHSEVITFEVAGRNGIEPFAAKMNYFAPDEAWVVIGALPSAFLKSFARGNTLTIRNGQGEEVVAFGLSGS